MACCVSFFWRNSSISLSEVVGFAGGGMLEIVTSWIVACPDPSTLFQSQHMCPGCVVYLTYFRESLSRALGSPLTLTWLSPTFTGSLKTRVISARDE